MKAVLKTKYLIRLLAGLAVLFSADRLLAYEKYLITMPGPKPVIAKSFKDLGSNKYEFVIDSSKKIKGDKAVTFDILKKSLLKKKIITNVSGDVNKIVVTYSSTTKKFLKKISKTRIKDYGASIDLAASSSMSDGGIRARTAAREPGAGEVKGTIVGKSGNSLRVMIQKKGPSGIPASFPMMRPIAVAAGSYKGTPGQVVFFKPTQKKGPVWQGKDFKNK